MFPSKLEAFRKQKSATKSSSQGAVGEDPHRGAHPLGDTGISGQISGDEAVIGFNDGSRAHAPPSAAVSVSNARSADALVSLPSAAPQERLPGRPTDRTVWLPPPGPPLPPAAAQHLRVPERLLSTEPTSRGEPPTLSTAPSAPPAPPLPSLAVPGSSASRGGRSQGDEDIAGSATSTQQSGAAGGIEPASAFSAEAAVSQPAPGALCKPSVKSWMLCQHFMIVYVG